MQKDIPKIVDECLARIRNGETAEQCLSAYPEVQEQVAPLLHTALRLSALLRVDPSDAFRNASKARLMTKIRQESQERQERPAPFRGLSQIWPVIWQAISPKKVAIPVALTLILILSICLAGIHDSLLSPPALNSQCTLNILSGSVEIQKPGSSSRQAGDDGMTLAVGTRVKTASDSHALLTFFEGSTIKLEPNSDVEIQRVESNEEQETTIVLKQWLGRTWSRVVKMADPGSHYQIETPSATAIVRGTMFATEVEATGSTKVTTTEGLVSVIAQGEEVQLPPNKQTQVETGTAPSQPLTAPGPKSEIIITVDMPAVASVTDPTGSSTGILQSGFSYNQILGSQSSFPSEDTQSISIVEPVSGEYTVALRYMAEGVAHFDIKGKSEGEVVFNYQGNWDAQEGSGWLIHLVLEVDDGKITGSEISTAETLGDKNPENIPETEMTNKEVKLKDIGVSEDQGKPDQPKDKGKPDQPEDKGKPDQPEDKGKPDQPEDKGKPDQPEDKGKPDQPEDKGKPDQPEDKGKPDQPEDKGKPDQPEDKGKPDQPEDKGKPDQPEDKGKPDQPEDKGKPDQPEDKGKPDQPEDKGKPDKLEDKGKPDQPEDKGKLSED